MLFKKNRTPMQKVGRVYRHICEWGYDHTEYRIKKSRKFLKKHEGLMGGIITTCIAAPIALGIAGSIAEKVEEKKAKKAQLEKENMTERAEEMAEATKAKRTQVGDIVIEN